MASESLGELREFAAELAWQAGKLTLRYFQTDFTIETKSDASPVTIADKESERLMRQMIEARYPHHSILGEEEGETRPGASFRWILDPIDGTKSFVRGVPLYSVLVGLEREGEPVVGAVNMPALGDFLHAAKGEGCLWNGRRTRVSSIDKLSESLVLCYDVEAMEQRGRFDEYRRIVESTKMQRTWGDAYGYVLVATGRGEVAMDPEMHPWDCAALYPVLYEAGGTFTDWRGTPSIFAGEAVATNGHVFEETMRVLGAR